jgi:hypothetical protein
MVIVPHTTYLFCCQASQKVASPSTFNQVCHSYHIRQKSGNPGSCQVSSEIEDGARAQPNFGPVVPQVVQFTEIYLFIRVPPRCYKKFTNCPKIVLYGAIRQIRLYTR